MHGVPGQSTNRLGGALKLNPGPAITLSFPILCAMIRHAPQLSPLEWSCSTLGDFAGGHSPAVLLSEDEATLTMTLLPPETSRRECPQTALNQIPPARLHSRAPSGRELLGVQSRFEVAVRTGLTPLVGREEELGLLRRHWERVKAGQGQVVLLSGEAGIGKSRLVLSLIHI